MEPQRADQQPQNESYDYIGPQQQSTVFNPNDDHVQSRAENLFRALKSVDLDKTGTKRVCV